MSTVDAPVVRYASDERESRLLAAEVKRFFEYWNADSDFRTAVRNGEDVSVPGVRLRAAEIRMLWDESQRPEARLYASTVIDLCPIPAVRAFLSWLDNRDRHLRKVRLENTPVNQYFQYWQSRQVARITTMFDRGFTQILTSPVYACELSDGCSVGCWFCGVDAPRVRSHFRYTRESAALWDDVLSVLVSICGARATARGLLYWATDPFDNPDYELFSEHFSRRFGINPHTTTALAARDITRTRRFLDRYAQREPFATRFSLLALRDLHGIFETFTASDLEFVDVVPQNRGAYSSLSASGRARRRISTSSGRNLDAFSSIACVSGFLINMVRRTVKLVSPCIPCDRWPNGHYVWEEASFDTPHSLAKRIEKMISCYMPLALPETAVRFREDLRLEQRPGRRLALVSRHGEVTFDGPYFAELGDAIARGDQTPSAIEQYFVERLGIAASRPRDWMLQLFRSGVLAEEPQRSMS